jgi:transposase InsO family protein
MGKGKRQPSPTNPSKRANSPLERLHCDIWGPARNPSVGGRRYFLTIVDDYSRYCDITFMRNKYEALNALEAFITKAENQLGSRVRSDGGGEFKSRLADQFYRNKGIIHTTTPPDAHAQNGRVERAHLTILDSVRTLLSDSQLPERFWAEAALYTVYTQNRLPCSDQTVPIAKFMSKEPVYRLFEPFGVVLQSYYISKLDNRYKSGQLLGYTDSSDSIRRIWDLENQKTQISRDIVFSKAIPVPTTPANIDITDTASKKSEKARKMVDSI